MKRIESNGPYFGPIPGSGDGTHKYWMRHHQDLQSPAITVQQLPQDNPDSTHRVQIELQVLNHQDVRFSNVDIDLYAVGGAIAEGHESITPSYLRNIIANAATIHEWRHQTILSSTDAPPAWKSSYPIQWPLSSGQDGKYIIVATITLRDGKNELLDSPSDIDPSRDPLVAVWMSDPPNLSKLQD